MNKISYSSVSAFNTCPKKWYLRYNRNLQKVYERPNVISLGRLFHQGMAAALLELYAWQRGDHDDPVNAPVMTAHSVIDGYARDTYPEVVQSVEIYDDQMGVLKGHDPEFEEEWQNNVDTAKGLVTRTLEQFDFAGNYRIIEIVEDTGEVIPAIELPIEHEFSSFKFRGRVDVILEDLNSGHVILLDWKTTGRLKEESDVLMLTQLPLYQKIINTIYDLGVTQCVYYQVRNRLPARPGQNKNGDTSRRKIITDRETFMNTVMEHGNEPTDYTDIEWLDEYEFFRPVPLVYSPDVINLIWDNFVASAHRIKGTEQFPGVYSFPCQQCPFHEYCWAELQGYDPDVLIEEGIYEVKQHE